MMIYRAAMLALVGVSLVGCQTGLNLEANSQQGSGLTGFPFSGGSDSNNNVVPTAEDFAGMWKHRRTITGKNCAGSATLSFSASGLLDIEQTGTSLVVNNLTRCGEYVYAETGVANDAIAMIEGDYSKVVSPRCMVWMHFEETIIMDGNQLDGNFVFNVINSTACEGGLTPCDYTGTITATWCPATDCSFPANCP